MILFCLSCSNMDEVNARHDILGTWEGIAHGMYSDAVTGWNGSPIIEYLPNGKGNCYLPGIIYDSNGQLAKEYNGYSFLGQFTYTIKNDILIQKYIDTGSKRRYRYRFFDNGEKLELIDADWTPIEQPTDDGPVTLRLDIHMRIYQRTDKY